MEKTPLTLSLSLSHKVNLGNYESADVFISISGVSQETTEAEIDDLLSGAGALAFKKCAGALKEKVSMARSATRATA